MLRQIDFVFEGDNHPGIMKRIRKRAEVVEERNMEKKKHGGKKSYSHKKGKRRKR